MAEKKSKVNEAGNYTMPGMRKKLLNKSKQADKVVSQGNGLHVKLRCLLNATKKRVEATQTDV